MVSLEVSLYLYGADLDPEAVTTILSVKPTTSRRKDEVRISSTGKRVVQKTGVWGYTIGIRTENVAESMRELLDRLVAELGQQENVLQSVPGAETGFIELLFSMPIREGSVGCEVELAPSQVTALACYGLPLRFTLFGSSPDRDSI